MAMVAMPDEKPRNAMKRKHRLAKVRKAQRSIAASMPANMGTMVVQPITTNERNTIGMSPRQRQTRQHGKYTPEQNTHGVYGAMKFDEPTKNNVYAIRTKSFVAEYKTAMSPRPAVGTHRGIK